ILSTRKVQVARDRSATAMFNADGSQVWCAGVGKEHPDASYHVKVLDASSGEEVRSLMWKPPEEVFASVFSTDHTHLALGGARGSVMLWNLAANEQKVIQQAHQGAVHCLALSPRRGLLASGGSDRIVKVWDLKTGTALPMLRSHKGAVTAL